MKLQRDFLHSLLVYSLGKKGVNVWDYVVL
jgi:hypothetical protein